MGETSFFGNVLQGLPFIQTASGQRPFAALGEALSEQEKLRLQQAQLKLQQEELRARQAANKRLEEMVGLGGPGAQPGGLGGPGASAAGLAPGQTIDLPGGGRVGRPAQPGVSPVPDFLQREALGQPTPQSLQAAMQGPQIPIPGAGGAGGAPSFPGATPGIIPQQGQPLSAPAAGAIPPAKPPEAQRFDQALQLGGAASRAGANNAQRQLAQAAVQQQIQPLMQMGVLHAQAGNPKIAEQFFAQAFELQKPVLLSAGAQLVTPQGELLASAQKPPDIETQVWGALVRRNGGDRVLAFKELNAMQAASRGQGGQGRIRLRPGDILVDQDTGQTITKNPKAGEEFGGRDSISRALYGNNYADLSSEQRRTVEAEYLEKRDAMTQSKAEGKQLSTSGQIKYQGWLGLQQSLEDALALHQDRFTGPVAGRLAGVKRMTGLAEADQQPFLQALASARNQIFNMISGAAVSESEGKRLEQELPNMADSPDVFKARLRQFHKRSGRMIKNVLDSETKTIRQLREQQERQPAARQPAPAAQPTPGVTQPPAAQPAQQPAAAGQQVTEQQFSQMSDEEQEAFLRRMGF